MQPSSPPFVASATTPGRKTRLFLDVPETTLVEAAWGFERRANQINLPAQAGQSHDNRIFGVKYWASGCWTLAPVQSNISEIHELSANRDLIIGPDKLTTINLLVAAATVALVAEENTFRRQNDVPDIEYRAGVLDAGDAFLSKRLPAGASARNSLLSGPAPPAETSSVAPMDRIAVGKETEPANQGFYLRFTIPGTARSAPDYVFGFHFGQYALYLRGSGMAELWEYCRDADNHAATRSRAQFRFAPAGRVANLSHALMIFPHLGPGGEQFIAFSGARSEMAIPGFVNSNVGESEFVYKADAALRGSDHDESPGAATRAGVIRLDVRRDLRPKVQISKLGFAPAGILIDLPAPALAQATSPLPVQIAPVFSRLSDGLAEVTATVLDASHDAGPFVPGEDSAPYASFYFVGDIRSTPCLWSYQMSRPEATLLTEAEPFEAGILRSMSLSGAGSDPTEATAAVHVSDLAGNLPRLAARGLFSAALVCDYQPPPGETPDASSTPVRVVLHRGYANRPDATRRGREGALQGVAGPRRLFPAAKWRGFDLNLTADWQRLSETQETAILRSFAVDPDAPPDPETGGPQPFKVTDKIRFQLLQCGFPAEQVDIPDLPFRLWPGADAAQGDATVQSGTDIAEDVVNTARNYLGAYLFWKANAGPDSDFGPVGQWTLLFGTPPDAPPLWTFVTKPLRVNLPPHLPQAYPPQTTFALDVSEQVVPPDFNCIVVSNTLALPNTAARVAVVNEAYNPKSCNFPGFTTRADPTHPDYLGRLRKHLVIDASLTGRTAEETQNNVDWTTRRLYDFLCHAQRLVHFTAPLVFVFDPRLSDGGRYRPLQFQDPVLFQDGNDPAAIYLVKAVHPHFTRDAHQMADYELIRPVTGQKGSTQGFFNRSGIGFLRYAQKQQTLKAGGSTTLSNLYSGLGVAPAAESAGMNLPVFTPTRRPLQDATGDFFFLPSFDPPNYDGPRRPL